jgi:hypothetical protein
MSTRSNANQQEQTTPNARPTPVEFLHATVGNQAVQSLVGRDPNRWDRTDDEAARSTVDTRIKPGRALSRAEAPTKTGPEYAPGADDGIDGVSRPIAWNMKSRYDRSYVQYCIINHKSLLSYVLA